MSLFTSINLDGLKIRHLTTREKACLFFIIAYLVDLLFDLASIGDDTKRHFFPFFHGFEDWGGEMTLENYVYGYSLNLWRMIVFYVFYLETGKQIWNKMVIVEFADCVDYAACYNQEWGYGIEFNHFKIIIVILLVLKHYGYLDSNSRLRE